MATSAGAGIAVLRDGARRRCLRAGIAGGREHVRGGQVPDKAGVLGQSRALTGAGPGAADGPARGARGGRRRIAAEDQAGRA